MVPVQGIRMSKKDLLAEMMFDQRLKRSEGEDIPQQRGQGKGSDETRSGKVLAVPKNIRIACLAEGRKMAGFQLLAP